MSVYHFEDGAKAVTGTSALFSVLIQFVDGRIVEVGQQTRETLHPLRRWELEPR